ncbi:stage III sporulation protein AH [Clostridium carboxidivorans P7]|uniref:Stage III sporulation protein AH n=1 Tax=Clostridium carboxidivorans P7 TaxID=536227 RepID=C6PQR9_9CLOT|nr:stage III sporulation protein AH [Clostridium carboxidivorans P7]
MNKKQAVIIVALLALIVCAGVLATKLNNPLYVNGGDNSSGKSTVSLNNNSSKDNKSEFFEEAKITRDNKNAQTLQTLKTFIDDKNVSKDKKEDASKNIRI